MTAFFQQAAFWASGALLLCAPGLSFAKTLIDNVDGHTLDKAGKLERFTGLLIDDSGKVEKLLTKREKRPENPDYRYDAKGLTLLPSMLIGQCDMLALGRRLQTIDLSQTASLEDALTVISAHASANALKPWIVGYGWDAAPWANNQTLSNAALDRAVVDRPALMLSADGRLGWANSKAISGVGKVPASAGILRGQALNALLSQIPPLRPVDRDAAYLAAQRQLVARGVSGLSIKNITIEDWQSFRRMGDVGSLQLRIAAYAADVNQMTLIGGPGPTPWLYNDRLRLNGLALDIDNKGWVDGGLLTSGTPLRNQMARAAMDDFQVLLTAISPQAAAEAEGAVAELSDSFRGDNRWRTLDASPWGPHSMGCDADPLGYVSGIRENSSASFDLAAVEAQLSNLERLKLVTTDQATAMQASDRFGSLMPGYNADFLIVSGNPFNRKSSQAARVLQIWIGGRRLSID